MATVTVELAWADLPRDHRALLESVGVTQHQVVAEPLGAAVDRLTISAGARRPTEAEWASLDVAVGVWVPSLKLVILNAEHPAVVGLDDDSYEALLARTAWHEWGHALTSRGRQPTRSQTATGWFALHHLELRSSSARVAIAHAS
ncbi:MAG: hypothetical protein GXY03_10250 [Solirubrobacterales bacterium]|nr:hypothetical protein [Solirubrobacterales bacterium]